MPWPGVADFDVIRNVRRGIPMSAPEGCPARVYGLMLKCWELQSYARIPAEDLELQLVSIKKSWDIDPNAGCQLTDEAQDSDQDDDVDNTHI